MFAWNNRFVLQNMLANTLTFPDTNTHIRLSLFRYMNVDDDCCPIFPGAFGWVYSQVFFLLLFLLLLFKDPLQIFTCCTSKSSVLAYTGPCICDPQVDHFLSNVLSVSSISSRSFVLWYSWFLQHKSGSFCRKSCINKRQWLANWKELQPTQSHTLKLSQWVLDALPGICLCGYQQVRGR